MLRYSIKFCTAIIFVLLAFNLNAQQENMLIQYLGTEQGLSQNEVTSISKDKYGFMWFGTRGGLNRYDGYEFKQFKPTREKNASIKNPSVEVTYVDKEGKIWIGLKSGGFSIYDPKKESFVHSEDMGVNAPDHVTAIYEDYKGEIWLGSFDEGMMACYSDQHFFETNMVNSIIQTNDSTLWCGAYNCIAYKTKDAPMKYFHFENGYHHITEMVVDSAESCFWLVGWEMQLTKFNYRDSTYEVFPLPRKNGASINSYSILNDNSGKLWVGSWGGGLFQFDKQKKEFSQYRIKPGHKENQTTNFDIILDIFKDEDKNIWIGTDGGGIVRLSPSLNFHSIVSQSPENNFNYSVINSTRKGELLLGTRGKGLFRTKDLKVLKSVPITKAKLPSEMGQPDVSCIYKDNDNVTWVSFDNGLYVLHEPANSEAVLIRAADFFNSEDLRLPNKVHSLLQKGDEFWVATQHNGLYLFKKKNNTYHFSRQFQYSRQEGGLKNNRVTQLFLDQKNRFWIGTYDGLYQYHAADSTFVPLNKLLQNSKLPLCNIILCSYTDRNNNFWFGTPCSLNKLVETGDNKFELSEFTTENGLPDDYINGILEGDDGGIWVSTNAGISRVNPENGDVRNYEVSHGVGGHSFMSASSYKDQSGILYFGGYTDLTYFNPKLIADNKSIPPIAITKIKIMNSEVPVSDDGILPVSINELDELELTYHEKVVSIEFAALDYKSPMQNHYAYKLSQDDKGEWNYIGNRRDISLRNLEPGEYTLHLRGSNSNGIWNDEGRILKIMVLPPPWKRWYALLAYLVIILSIIALITKVAITQERLEHDAKMEHVKREQGQQLNEYKLNFFTNISHEFRTPLTLILAPIKELMNKDFSDVDPDVKNKIEVISRNSNRLLNLINQLLEFRKVEAGKSVLEATEIDFIEFLKENTQSFAELAKHRKIDFVTEYKVSNQPLYFDALKMVIVINNLFSNAFKYCGEPGKVKMIVEDNETSVTVRIINNGHGIPEKEQKHIFDSFYQISDKRYPGSSGLGLAIVKSYLEMHSGSLLLKSEVNKDTEFAFSLLKGRDHLKDSEIVTYSKSANNLDNEIADLDWVTGKPAFHHKGTKGARLVVVEDNPELQSYLVEFLSEYYEVIVADNGKQGLEKVIECQPNLVVSDVMMPVMDGYELCLRIKSNDLTSHIPVILLTAKISIDDKIFGTQKGADAYLTKPFDPQYLLENIKQLISSRKELAGKYMKKVTLEPTRQEITKEDEKMLNTAMAVIEKNIGDVELNLDFLASKLSMSSTTLYRKFKAVSGQTPGEFIKKVRLKRAAQLLKDSDRTVSEIVELVGYQDIKRFRESFQNEYGLSPSEYRKSTPTV